MNQVREQHASGDAVVPRSADSVFANHVSTGIQRVLNEYLQATQQPFAKHPMAAFIRAELPALVQGLLRTESRHLIVEGSPGKGNWARGPWIALFDPFVTTSAQKGYYGCLLFREDMRGAYLCLTQAMTEAKALYRADAKTALKARAQNFRAMIGGRPNNFDLDNIDLAPSSPQNDTSFYEAGNVLAKFYPSGEVPADSVIRTDLEQLSLLYNQLLSTESATASSLEIEPEPSSRKQYEDASRRRLHERIERNPRLVKDVKRIRGTTCEACGTSFGEKYGELGDGYIEAHHLKPISTLERGRVELDPKKDFAVLCSNCHRMIHRSDFVHDVGLFRERHLKLRS
ncbi:DUF3578 domain-containing protein [Luteibacter sp. 329MFSha]|uniref:MrcB family domain-containing protein n=1 Tax=Luteibacter sp. 329MFSha TaxID=1798239 RepID=UPI0008B12742|nr:DUF3578 domain-containing protein [Luteibacter sp. 329MFSha]SEW06491.1 5-methylcytosine-specific restriction enzyme A [Luteibacter sp. 329MFSha]